MVEYPYSIVIDELSFLVEGDLNSLLFLIANEGSVKKTETFKLVESVLRKVNKKSSENDLAVISKELLVLRDTYVQACLEGNKEDFDKSFFINYLKEYIDPDTYYYELSEIDESYSLYLNTLEAKVDEALTEYEAETIIEWFNSVDSKLISFEDPDAEPDDVQVVLETDSEKDRFGFFKYIDEDDDLSEELEEFAGDFEEEEEYEIIVPKIKHELTSEQQTAFNNLKISNAKVPADIYFVIRKVVGHSDLVESTFKGIYGEEVAVVPYELQKNVDFISSVLRTKDTKAPILEMVANRAAVQQMVQLVTNLFSGYEIHIKYRNTLTEIYNHEDKIIKQTIIYTKPNRR